MMKLHWLGLVFGLLAIGCDSSKTNTTGDCDCDYSAELCEVSGSDIEGEPSHQQCVPLPDDCQPGACDCLGEQQLDNIESGLCTCTERDGEVTVECLGG